MGGFAGVVPSRPWTEPGWSRSLRRDAAGEVRDDAATRELYAADASIYRRRPLASLRARDAADLDAALAACRDHGVPLTMRGAGTSLAGQAVGAGLVVDCSALDDVADRPRRPARRAWAPAWCSTG